MGEWSGRIVGLNVSHDSSACLVEDGVVVSALALERTTGVKRGVVPHHLHAGAMADLVGDLLTDRGLDVDDVDRWIATSTETLDEDDERWLLRSLGLLVPPDKQLVLPHPGHHLAHAAGAFYSSGCSSAAALVIDAYGSRVGTGRERETGFWFDGHNPPERVFAERRPSARIAGTLRGGQLMCPRALEGLGEVYRVVTLALGFFEGGTTYDDAGKTMGLSAFGRADPSIRRFIEVGDGTLGFDQALPTLVEEGLAEPDGDVLRLLPRLPSEPLTRRHQDLAAQLQLEFEDACLALASRLIAETGSRSLVLSGGCFLNSVANARLARTLDLDDLFVYPAATDDGNAVGAALYAHHHICGTSSTPSPRIRSARLGPRRVDDDEVERVATGMGLTTRRHSSVDTVVESAAGALADGQIVGWFQDHGEFGPRALGSRSIVCHPGLPGMKDRLNARVKFRERFRPFGASVLAEQAPAWFDMPTPDQRFMLMVSDVRDARSSEIAEVVHVDGTCRLQTVDPGQDDPYRRLIEAFYRRTGLPLVLNTSFNLRGMPIVEHPRHALACLVGSRLDRVVIGRVEVAAPDLAQLVPIASGSTDNHDPDVMAAVDGRRTVAEVADVADRDVDATIDVLLDLRRRGAVGWRHLDVAPRPAFAPQYVPTPIDVR